MSQEKIKQENKEINNTNPTSKSPKNSSNSSEMSSESPVSTSTSQSFFNTRQANFTQVIQKSDKNNQIEVQSFLNACKFFAEVYDVIGGTTFAPLKADVMGNVTKLQNKAKEYQVETIEEIVEFEINKKTTTSKGSGTDALVWLKRGLWLFCQFLTNVLNGEENAQKAFSKSYDVTLAKHHNFIVKRLFSVGLMAFPSWETLMPLFLTKHEKSEGTEKEVLHKHLSVYLGGMRPLLEQLDLFYVGKGLSN